MKKPTIFFSHSSRDKKQLVRLKELFIQKTGGSIDVFLSSDGQSIPLGRNWVYRIQEALENAALMIVFVSPDSLRSNWLYFESGYAYSKGIRVVPVGFLGIDLTTLPPPLSLLQGFNINSEEGLNNIIALTNETFGHSHSAQFTVEEYQEICLSSRPLSTIVFGNFGSLVDNIKINLSERNDGLTTEPIAAIDRITELLKKENIEHDRSERSVNFHGVSIAVPDGIQPPPLEISVDPGIADVALPKVERIIREIRSDGINGISIRFDFISTVECLTDRHKISGRVYGTDVKLSTKDHLILRDIEFYISHLFYLATPRLSRRGATYVSMRFVCTEIPLSQIRELLEFLFEREILYIEPRSIEYVE